MLEEEHQSQAAPTFNAKPKRKTVRAVTGQYHRRSSRNRASHHRARTHFKRPAKERAQDGHKAISIRELTNSQERDASSSESLEPMQVDHDPAVHNELSLSNEEEKQLVRDMSLTWQARGTDKSIFDIMSFAKLSSVARLKFLRRSEQ